MIRETYITLNDATEYLGSVEHFDSRLNLLLKEVYNAGEIVFKESYIYDSSNNLIQSKEESLLDEEFTLKKFLYEGDKLIEVVCNYPGDGHYIEKYVYNELNQLQSRERVDGGEFDFRHEYEYGDSIETQKHFGNDGKLFYEKKVERKLELGHVIEIQKEYSEYGDRFEKQISNFNNNGQITSVQFFENDYLVSEEIYSFDKNGNEIQSIRKSNDSNEKIEIFKEWDAQNLIDLKEYRNDALIIHKSYKYDENSRVINEIILEFEVETGYKQLIKRRFEYR